MPLPEGPFEKVVRENQGLRPPRRSPLQVAVAYQLHTQCNRELFVYQYKSLCLSSSRPEPFLRFHLGMDNNVE
jgi:hypothetical protein